MDFARKQLEKYGWSDGKGLGRHENGISEALKPKIKRSVTGVGHNAAQDFTEHWWTTLYNKAASNVEVEQKNDTTKRIKTKDPEPFEITNSTWKLQRKSKGLKEEGEYTNFFVKTAILGNGGSKVEKLKESDSEEESIEDKKDVFKMTDEELFAACGGRTAHKGARFGLKATGKLARIKQQEENLLNLEKYSGYSHAKKRKTDEDVADLKDVEMIEETETKNKKVKSNTDFSEEHKSNDYDNDVNSSSKLNKKRKKSKKPVEYEETVLKQTVDEEDPSVSDIYINIEDLIPMKKKSKKNKKQEAQEINTDVAEIVDNTKNTKKKKYKKKKNRNSDTESIVETSNLEEESEVK